MTAMIHTDFLNHSSIFKRALMSFMEMSSQTHFKYKLVESCTFGVLLYMWAILWFPQSACSSGFVFNSEQFRLDEPEWHWCQMVWKYAKAENINVLVLCLYSLIVDVFPLYRAYYFTGFGEQFVNDVAIISSLVILVRFFFPINVNKVLQLFY